MMAKKHTVWFGNYDGLDFHGSVQWRVLSGGTDTDPDEALPISSTGEALLISECVLNHTVDFKLDGSSTAWSGSDAEKWCQDLYINWPAGLEKNAIKATTINETNNQTRGDDPYFYYYYSDYSITPYFLAAPLTNEHFFFLSVREADHLFNDDEDRIAKVLKGAACFWWLRSPTEAPLKFDGAVSSQGRILGFPVGAGIDNGARPAFNLNLTSVLFASAAKGGKSIADEIGGMYRIPSGSKTEWKLTLKDSGRSGFASNAASLTGEPGDKISIPYSGAKTGDNEYVSILICGSDGTAQYYGSYKISVASGTAVFALPEDLDAGYYTVKLFNEQRNGNHESDYASEFKETSLKVVSYSCTSGDGQTWIRGAGNAKAASFTFKGSPSDADTYKNFTGIRVDGTDVEEEDFTARQGSVVIGLRAPYLESLADGQHTLTAVFTDGEADAGFKIKQSPGKKPVNGGSVPRTGDGSHPALWALLAVVSLAALAMRRRS